MDRLTANRRIISELSRIVEKYPDWRFHQILQNVEINVKLNNRGLIDFWYEESEDTLKRLITCL